MGVANTTTTTTGCRLDTPSAAGIPRRDAPVVAAGDTVTHERWGEGIVLTVSGNGDGTEATIWFPEVGEKRVLLAYAPLKG